MTNEHIQKREIKMKHAIFESGKISNDRKIKILSMSATEIANKIKSQELTCQEVLLTFMYKACTTGQQLSLLADFDYEHAYKDAIEKDKQIREGKIQQFPPLFGVPIIVKEQLAVKHMVTTLGLQSRTSTPPMDFDCAFVQILREAGAIPFATSNVPQGLLAIESTNQIYGQGKNPYNRDFTCGGSSGGSAGLISAQCAPLAVSSDALGSIRIPSAFCGIYGFKPTGKRISKKGRFGLSGTEIEVFNEIIPSLGPMSRFVDDLIISMKLVFENVHSKDTQVPPSSFNQNIFDKDVKQLKIGFLYETPMWPSFSANRNVIDEVKKKLEEQGFQNIQEFNFPDLDKLNLTIMRMLNTPGVSFIIRRLLKGENMLNLHTKHMKIQALPQFLRSLFSLYQKKKGNLRFSQMIDSTEKMDFIEFMEQVGQKEQIRMKFIEYWKQQQFDILISPVAPFTATCFGDNADMCSSLSLCCFQNIVDLPAGVCPIRLVKKDETNYQDKFNDNFTRLFQKTAQNSEGLPACIQITGGQWQDELTLRFMKEIEQYFPFTKKFSPKN